MVREGAIRQEPSSAAAVARHLATRPEFEGIGFAKAARLVEAFGDELAAVLGGGDASPLVPILGEELAASLIAAWRAHLARGDVLVWLAENGLDPRFAGRVVDLWGADALGILSANPYAMMALESFRKVDAAAVRLGRPRDDPDRLAAAVEDVLYRRLDAGHTWTEDGRLHSEVADAIGEDLAARALDVAAADGAASPLENGWQSAGCAAMEDFVAIRLASMAAGPATGDLVARHVEPDEVSTFLAGWTTRHGVPVDADQAHAVLLATTERIALVTGGAGVGKTTVLQAVAAACDAFGRTTVMVALAGRAAVRISESTGRPAMTVAAFLRKCTDGAIALGPETLLVVDEASMLDLPTLYRILRALPEESRLLLVGDPGQLPPIGFGLTFHVLVGTATIPKVELTRVYRQSGGTGIPAISRGVRLGRIEAPPPYAGRAAGVSLVGCRREDLRETIVDLAAEIGGIGDDLRVLCAVKAAAWGTEGLNERFHDIVSAGRDTWLGIALGEPVMFLRNDYRRDLRNGSLGVATGVEEGELICDMGDGRTERFSEADRKNLALAYAMTVHKAQGSQFARVIVPIVGSRILDRALIYTAITRATDQVVLVGDKEVLRKAVEAEAAASRRSVGLGFRLNRAAGGAA